MAEFDNPCIPVYEGDDVTGKASAAVVGGTFADISADKDLALGTSVGATNDIIVTTCAAGAAPIGVFKYDQPTVGGVVGLHCKSKRILPMIAGAGGVTAGQEVEVGASGRPITFSAGIKAGQALTTAAAGSIAWIQVY